jgi:hypothetical protein
MTRVAVVIPNAVTGHLCTEINVGFIISVILDLVNKIDKENHCFRIVQKLYYDLI